jgi:hypothetical protein
VAIDVTSGRLNASVSSGPTLSGGVTAVFWCNVLSVAAYNELVILDDVGGNQLRIFTDPSAIMYGAIGADNNLAAQSFSTSTWMSVAMTYDGSTYSLYINGNVTTAAATHSSTVNSIQVGSAFVSNAFAIQDLMVYGRVLSAVELADASRLRRPLATSLVAWYPFLGGGTRLTDFSGLGRTLSVSTGSVSDYATPPGVAWNAPQILQGLRSASATSITAAGTTQTTGAASITKTAALVATGTTQTTGAATVTKSNVVATGTTQVTGAATLTKTASLVATGTTNVTGAAAMTATASLTATGTTQVTGAATFENEYRQGSTTDLSASHSLAAWIFPTASQTSHVFRTRMSTPGNDRDSGGIEINGTTINFFANNSANSAAYSYSQAISLNTWTYVSLVYDSSAKTYTSYVNAISVDSASFDGTGREPTWNEWALYGNFVGSMRAALIADNYAMSAPQLARTMLTRLSSAEYTGIVTGQSGIFLPFWSSVNSRFLFASRTAGGGAFVSVRGAPDDFPAGNPPGSWQGQTIIRPLVTPSAAISITATGLTQTTGAAATTEAAALVATGTTQTTGSAALTAAAAIVATGTTQTTGAASTTETAALVATGTTQTTGAAALTSAAGLVAAGLTQVTGASNLTTPGDVAGTGLTQVTGAASLTAAAPLAAAGTTQTTGAAALTSTAPLVAAGNTQTTGAAAVTSTAAIVAAGLTQTSGAAVISIAYSLTAAGTTITTGAAAFQGVSPPGSGGDNDNASRRWLGALGTRRRLRR